MAAWQLPPLILHPFNGGGSTTELVEGSRASLTLQGLLQTDGSTRDADEYVAEEQLSANLWRGCPEQPDFKVNLPLPERPCVLFRLGREAQANARSLLRPSALIGPGLESRARLAHERPRSNGLMVLDGR